MSGRFWPIADPAQADYEQLRAIALAEEKPGDLLAAQRFGGPCSRWSAPPAST